MKGFENFELAGKVALITGATGHMGSDFTRTLVGAGASVILVSRTEAKLKELCSQIEADGGAAAYHVCDVRDREATGRLAEVVVPFFGGVDIVLNNATVGQQGGSDLLTTPLADWREAYDVIVWGALEVCKSLQPSMAGRGGGSIINVVSSTGVTPTPGFAAYGMAKGSLILLTKYMAKEWGPQGIRANCLNPGSIARAGTEEAMQAYVEKLGISDRISLRRVGRDPEVLDTALFLASSASSYISGQVINIDGGRF